MLWQSAAGVQADVHGTQCRSRQREASKDERTANAVGSSVCATFQMVSSHHDVNLAILAEVAMPVKEATVLDILWCDYN